MTRYYGWYANRPRGTRRKAAADVAIALIHVAELLRRIYEVDPLTCPACGGTMRILAFITEAVVIDQILARLAHLRRTRSDARGPPSTHRPARRAMRPAPTLA